MTTRRQYIMDLSITTLPRIRQKRIELKAALQKARSSMQAYQQTLTDIANVALINKLARDAGVDKLDFVETLRAQAINKVHAEAKIHKRTIEEAKDKSSALRDTIKTLVEAEHVTSLTFINTMKKMGEYIPGTITHTPENDTMSLKMKYLYLDADRWLDNIRVSVNCRTRRVSLHVCDDSTSYGSSGGYMHTHGPKNKEAFATMLTRCVQQEGNTLYGATIERGRLLENRIIVGYENHIRLDTHRTAHILREPAQKTEAGHWYSDVSTETKVILSGHDRETIADRNEVISKLNEYMTNMSRSTTQHAITKLILVANTDFYYCPEAE